MPQEEYYVVRENLKTGEHHVVYTVQDSNVAKGLKLLLEQYFANGAFNTDYKFHVERIVFTDNNPKVTIIPC